MIFRPIFFIIYLFSSILLLAQDVKSTQNAVVFMYHRFGEKTYPSTNITLEQFDAQLTYLKKNNYEVWPLSKIVGHIIDKKELPQKLVALTIDDAYRSIYEDAYPLLKKRNFPFSIFVHTSAVDHRSKSFLTWDEIKEMQENGAEILNHTFSHDYLTPKKRESKSEWQQRVRDEIQKAQTRLHEKLGADTNESPKLLSYPYGEYSRESADFIKSLGYIGVSQTSGVLSPHSDLRAIPRFPMSQKYASIEDFVLKLNTKDMRVEAFYPLEPLVNKNNPPTLHIKLKEALRDFSCYNSNGERLDIVWLNEIELRVISKEKLKAPRDKYTCTARTPYGEWYWYSHLWIIEESEEKLKSINSNEPSIRTPN